MPEIAEVARVVHFIRTNLVGRTIASVKAKDDNKIFDAVGTSASEYEKQLQGKKIVGAGQQGKYFWIELDKPPHPLMHFGMTGWLHIRNVHTYYYAKNKDTGADKEWPPKFTKWEITTEPDGDKPSLQAAFVDSRRFGRCRLIDCDAKNIRKVTPLKENGPDPVIDKDIVTVEWLALKCKPRSVPIKAFLLDQANISGIGNWVGDDVLYDAKIHPETYCKDLSANQIQRLHDSIHYICGTACELLGESERFPKSWLFHYRWGKKGPNDLPITWLTVGGRSTAVIATVQKKSDGAGATTKEKPAKTTKRAKTEDESEEKATKSPSKKLKEEVDEEQKPSSKRSKVEAKPKAEKPAAKAQKAEAAEPSTAQGRRKSQRLGK